MNCLIIVIITSNSDCCHIGVIKHFVWHTPHYGGDGSTLILFDFMAVSKSILATASDLLQGC